MSKYLYVFRNEILLNLTYKGNIISSFIVQIIQMITTVFVWRALYSGENDIGNYNISEMTTYLILTSLLSVIFSPNSAFRLSNLISSGKLSILLIRPYSYFFESFSVFLGQKVVQICVVFIMIICFFMLGLFQFSFPNIVSILLVLTNFILLFIFLSVMGELSFWLIEMWPLRPIYNGLLSLFGGVMFPLDLLPESILNIIQFTPFSLFGYVNTKAIMGELSTDAMFNFLIASMLWIIFFQIIYIILWKKGLKKYEGVGI
ncbi:ABC transporter permease [Caldibacillus debilis]|uniref:ABC transporter permease n=1 Tax=Caldibacillus debilis TaxID=301148 RepID=UPI00036A749C|nr:ABC-2 family transporter protein [Caldibacillus debilis]